MAELPRFSETKISVHNKQLSDIEVSRAYDSQTCDEIRSKQSSIDKQLLEATTSKTSIVNQHEKLQAENARLSESIIDLQARSMRDNLLFYNFPECSTGDERSSEKCTNKVLEFCENTLGIENASVNIKLDRAHRIGRYDPGKKRPIVAKFNYHQDKISVKFRAKDKLAHSDYGVGDQFPKAIQDRRRELIPLLVQAKKEGKRAVLALDKLYVNNVLVSTNAHPRHEPML